MRGIAITPAPRQADKRARANSFFLILLEALAYISTEIHKSFKPFFSGAGDEEKSKAGEMILKRMGYVAETMQGDFLFGSDVSVADCYLFVMLLWAQKNGLEAPAKLAAFRGRMMERPAVHKAMTHEGLSSRGDQSDRGSPTGAGASLMAPLSPGSDVTGLYWPG